MAKVNISFDAWKNGNVTGTSHMVPVTLPKVAHKTAPVAANLIGSLKHPATKANMWEVKFSGDGSKIFSYGYPSGIIQIWDVARRKELRRIESPAGYRGSGNYALLTPDWKTLYVPVSSRKVRSFEKNDKRFTRFDYSGEIRVWDMTNGKSLPPIKLKPDRAPAYAKLSPDGKQLWIAQQLSYAAGEAGDCCTIAISLQDRTQRKVCNEFAIPFFSPDEKRVAFRVEDRKTGKFSVRIHDVASGKELSRFPCPDKKRDLSVSGFSPDGSLLAVTLGGKKGAPVEILFRGGISLADRGRFVGESDNNGFGWAYGCFTSDSRHYLVLNSGKVNVWRAADNTVVQTLKTGGSASRGKIACSPDGAMAAVMWMPKYDDSLGSDPDPVDLPQPRIALLDLTGKTPPRTLICPHGYTGGLAFSPDGTKLAAGGAGAVHLFDLLK